MTDLEDRILTAVCEDLQEELPWFDDLSPEDQQALVEQYVELYQAKIRAMWFAWQTAAQEMMESLKSCLALLRAGIERAIEHWEDEVNDD